MNEPDQSAYLRVPAITTSVTGTMNQPSRSTISNHHTDAASVNRANATAITPTATGKPEASRITCRLRHSNIRAACNQTDPKPPTDDSLTAAITAQSSNH